MQIKNIVENEAGKYMRSKFRMIYKGGVYHVTQRAPGSERIFLDDSDKLKFIYLLEEISREFDLKIFAFSLLPNHLHLLLQINEKNLSQAMKSLLENYAMYFNHKYERKGHVFCGPFRASVVDGDSYFLAASVYIHLNALRAGLCDNYESYRWHSVKLFTEEILKETFIHYRYVLGLLNKDVELAKKAYKRLLEESASFQSKDEVRPKMIERAIRECLKFVEIALGIKPNYQNMSRNTVIKQLLASGCKMKEVRLKLGISRSTLYRFLNADEEK